MTINTTQLQTDLQTRLNNLTGSESADSVLALTAAVDNLTSNRFISVSNYANLPNLAVTPLPSGSIVFIEQFNVLMMSVGTQWRGIDGRIPIAPVTAWSWGSNLQGRLGDNSTTSRSSPVTVVGGITTWSRVSAGEGHTLLLTTTGNIHSVGKNDFGQLGDNSTASRSSPVTVVGGITNWSQVSAGYRHSLAITLSGIAYAWGGNNSGQLGDNSTTSRSSPVTVVGGITTWSQVSASLYHSLGLTSTGIAYAWGNSYYGRTGLNSQTDRSSPNIISGGITNWKQVSAGSSQTSMGVTNSGITYTWGRNVSGQLGDNTTSNRSSPVTVVGGIITWNQVSAGGVHCLGLTSAGILYAWGNNSQGRLGDNTTSNRSSPVTVVGGITNWNIVVNGAGGNLGLTSGGILYSWGSGTTIGDNTTSNRSSPVTVAGGITTWTSISVNQHAIGLAT